MLTALILLLSLLNSVRGTAEPITYFLIVDESGSMSLPGHDPNGRRLDAAANLVYQLDSTDFIEIIGFGTGARIILPLTKVDNNRSTIIHSLRNIRSNQKYTMINSPLLIVLNELNKINTKHSVVILLTDGQLKSSDLPDSTNVNQYFHDMRHICEEIAKKRVPIFTIAFTSKSNLKLLQEISAITNGVTFRALVPLDIGKIYGEIMTLLPKGYTKPLYQSGKNITKKISVDNLTTEIRITAYKRNIRNPKPTIIVYSPHGKVIRGERYETNSSITVIIKNPIPGNWTIQAKGITNDIDVQLITRKYVQIEILSPKRGEFLLYKGETKELKLKITPHDTNLKTYVFITTPSGKILTYKLKPSKNGVWSVYIGPLTETGTYHMKINIKSPTGSEFQRQLSFFVNPFAPLDISINTSIAVQDPVTLGLKVNLPKHRNAKFDQPRCIIKMPDGTSKTLFLYDSGKKKHGDLISGDNFYHNVFLPQKGFPAGKYICTFSIKSSIQGEQHIFRKDTFFYKSLKVTTLPVEFPFSKLHFPIKVPIKFDNLGENILELIPLKLRVNSDDLMGSLECPSNIIYPNQTLSCTANISFTKIQRVKNSKHYHVILSIPYTQYLDNVNTINNTASYSTLQIPVDIKIINVAFRKRMKIIITIFMIILIIILAILMYFTLIVRRAFKHIKLKVYINYRPVQISEFSGDEILSPFSSSIAIGDNITHQLDGTVAILSYNLITGWRIISKSSNPINIRFNSREVALNKNEYVEVDFPFEIALIINNNRVSIHIDYQ